MTHMWQSPKSWSYFVGGYFLFEVLECVHLLAKLNLTAEIASNSGSIFLNKLIKYKLSNERTAF
jgi:hypothetical protein